MRYKRNQTSLHIQKRRSKLKPIKVTDQVQLDLMIKQTFQFEEENISIDLQSEQYLSQKGHSKKRQYLAMRNYLVQRDLKTKNILFAVKKKRSVNKILNSGCDLQNDQDILDLLFKRNSRVNFKQIRSREIALLNNFYKKTTENISSLLADGIVSSPQKRQYCKTPKIQFKAQESVPRFEHSGMEIRFKKQQTVARSFVFYDYGFPSLQAELSRNSSAAKVELRKYRNILCTVLTEAFRRLQTFAIQHCLMQVKPLNRQQLKTLSMTLIHCRKYLSNSDCDTLLKYVSMSFCLNDVTISADASVKLMSALHSALKRRTQQKNQGKELISEASHKYQMHRIWNGQFERLLIDSYHRENDPAKIARIFQKTYPKQIKYFTPEAIKTRLNRTLREAIKKLQFFSEGEDKQSKLPKIGCISKFGFKSIVDSSHYYRLRLMLLDVNSAESPPENLLISTIKALNESIRTWDSIEAERRRNRPKNTIQDNDFMQQLRMFELELDEK